MKISVAIMAHPKRSEQANWLFAKLVTMGRFKEVCIIWDEKNDEWHTGQRAWECGKGVADWHLVVQDDALISDPHSLYENIESMIRAVPTKSVISLYTGKVRPLPERVTEAVAKAPDGSFITHYMLMWGVAILLPTDHIEPMLDFLDEPKYNDTKYDIRIGIFYQRNRLPIYYSMPSLFDHNDDFGSLIGNDYEKEPRVAHRLATGRVDWTDRVITL